MLLFQNSPLLWINISTPYLPFSLACFFLTTAGYAQQAQLAGIISNRYESLEGVAVDHVEITVNQGTQAAYGGTFRANYVRDFDLWTLEAYGSYTYADGQIITTDTTSIDQPFTAHHTFKAGFSLTNRRFSVSPRVVARSQTTGNGGNVYGQAYASPAFWVVNLHTQYRFLISGGKQRLAVYAKINNLLDNRYYNVFFGGDTGFVGIPQDPFRWNAGLRIEI